MAIVPDLAALHASHSGVWYADARGTLAISRGEAMARAAETPLIMLNAPLVATRLGYPIFPGWICSNCSPSSIPRASWCPRPRAWPMRWAWPNRRRTMQVPALLQQAAGRCCSKPARDPDWAAREGAWSALQSLVQAALALGVAARPRDRPARARRTLAVLAPARMGRSARTPAARASHARSGRGVEQRLAQLTGSAMPNSAPASAPMPPKPPMRFAPRRQRRRPHMLLAQAGTGIGKTLGYLAPASLWAEQAGGTVWVSTYTKALQRQLPRKPPRLAGSRADGSQARVVRKGRENYLCLLNLEDALQGGFAGRAAILAQLVARWAAYTQDGDMIGGDLPGWLPTLFRRAASTALTDRRGECVYAGCPHYRKCFIERASRASAGRSGHRQPRAGDGQCRARARSRAAPDAHRLRRRPSRVRRGGFDLRRGADRRRDDRIAPLGDRPRSARRERARRGLSARLADLASYDEAGGLPSPRRAMAAEALPGWLAATHQRRRAIGPIEELLAAVRATVYARDESGGQKAGLWAGNRSAQLDGRSSKRWPGRRKALGELRQPLIRLGQRLEALLAEPPDWLDGQGRARIEGARQRWLAGRPLAAGIALLGRGWRAGRSRIRRLAGGRSVRGRANMISASTAAGSIR
jgi:ATP-dependent DNA helicase DinG